MNIFKKPKVKPPVIEVKEPTVIVIEEPPLIVTEMEFNPIELKKQI